MHANHFMNDNNYDLNVICGYMAAAAAWIKKQHAAVLLNYEIISYSKNSRGKLLMMGYTLSH